MPNTEIEAVLLFNLLATKDRLATSGDLLGSRITSEIRNERRWTSMVRSKLSAENELLF